MHDSQALNRVTEANERVYLILRTTVRLSHPAPMDLVLRKRLSINIKKGQTLTDRLKKFRLVRGENAIWQSGVTYEVVSNIPKASEELEDRESLAQLAASGDDCSASDGETYIGKSFWIELLENLMTRPLDPSEKYTRGVSAVESILTLDRLRQNVAVKELETAHGQPLSMRKTVSVPNFSQVRTSANWEPHPAHPIELLLPLRRLHNSSLPPPPLNYVLPLTHLTHSSKINQEHLTKRKFFLFSHFSMRFHQTNPQKFVFNHR